MREIEIKLKVTDLNSVVSKLEKLGCKISKPKTQEDRNFVHKDDTKWFESTKSHWVYPRLRIQNGQPLIFTVKKPVENESACIEHELEVNDAEELEAIMKMFEYKPGVTIRKTRRTSIFNNYNITLDEVDKLGNFIEIELIVTDGNAIEIQEEMFRFAEKTFGLKRGDIILKGYDILMHELENN